MAVCTAQPPDRERERVRTARCSDSTRAAISRISGLSPPALMGPILKLRLYWVMIAPSMERLIEEGHMAKAPCSESPPVSALLYWRQTAPTSVRRAALAAWRWPPPAPAASGQPPATAASSP